MNGFINEWIKYKEECEKSRDRLDQEIAKSMENKFNWRLVRQLLEKYLTRCGLATENFTKLASGSDAQNFDEKLCKRCFVHRALAEPNEFELECANRQNPQSSGSPSKTSAWLATELNGDPVSPTQEASDAEGFTFEDADIEDVGE